MIEPFISVIIPVWNRPHYLKQSAESVLKQTYTNFELIIVDDGSTDSTLQVAYKLAKDKRVKVIKKEHSGATDTFNRGLREMSGDVFCLLGSDDLWLSEKLEQQVKVHNEYPDCVLHTEAYRIQSNGKLNPKEHKAKSKLKRQLGGCAPTKFYERHYKRPFAAFFGSSLFVPKSVIDKMGDDSFFADVVGQDYYWVLDACLLYNIKFRLIPEYLVKSRTNPDSTTGREYKKIVKEAENIWRTMHLELERRREL